MYYVYLLKDPITKLPFYVGKGKGNRAQYHTKQNQQGKNTENPYKDHVIRQILNEGLTPMIEYVFWSEDEKSAYNFEEELITKYGMKCYNPVGILTNLCKDNRPPHNEYSEDRKQIYRARMIGNTLNKGRIQSQEEKYKRAESLKKAYSNGTRKVTDKMREVLRKTHSGKVVSDETRKKQSDSAKINNAWKIGKTFEEIFGIEKAKEIKEKKSKFKPSNCKIITINGIIYQSIREAATKLNTTEYKAKKLIDTK